MNNDVRAGVIAHKGNCRDNSWLMHLEEKEANTLYSIFYGIHIRTTLRIFMHIEVHIHGTVDSILVLQLNCRVAKKWRVGCAAAPLIHTSSGLLTSGMMQCPGKKRMRAPEVPSAKQTGENSTVT